MKNMFATLAVTCLSIGLFAACTSQNVPSQPSERTSAANFKAADLNRDGQLSYKEYLTLTATHEAEASVATHRQRKVNQEASTMQANLKNRFNKLDTDNDGWISQQELGVQR